MLIVLAIFFMLLVLRLWSLQVVQAGRYRELGLRNRKRSVNVRPVRGRIFDRHGQPLADNRPRLDACVDYSEARTRADRDRVVEVLRDVLAMPEAEIRARLDPRKVIPYVPVTRRPTFLVARATGDPSALIPAVRQIVNEIDSNLAVTATSTSAS